MMLKKVVAQQSVEREFHQQEELQTDKRETFTSLEAYLSTFKTLCDELAAIDKALPDDRKCFWLL